MAQPLRHDGSVHTHEGGSKNSVCHPALGSPGCRLAQDLDCPGDLPHIHKTLLFSGDTLIFLGCVRSMCLASATQIPWRLACPMDPTAQVAGLGGRGDMAAPAAAEGPAGGSTRFPQEEGPLFQSLSSLCIYSNSSPKQVAKKGEKNMKGSLLTTGESPSWRGAPSLRTTGL